MTTAKLNMITNSNGVSSPAPITFTTGLSTVTFTPKLHRSSVRYLGVCINLNKSRTIVLNQCKKEISVCCSLLRSKRASDKQLLYVYNMVIIPRLEYLTQITILTAKECRQIITPFRILFKNKLQMDRMTHNAIMNYPFIYTLRYFYELKLE